MLGSHRLSILLCLVFASCGGPCGRTVRKVTAAFEILAWICGGVFVLVFVGGGVVALVKNVRAPSARSKRWGLMLGGTNLVFAVLFLGSAILQPPHEIVTERVDEVVEVVHPGSGIVEEIVSSDRAAEGGIDWLVMSQLLGFGLVWTAFGFVSVRASRKPEVAR